MSVWSVVWLTRTETGWLNCPVDINIIKLVLPNGYRSTRYALFAIRRFSARKMRIADSSDGQLQRSSELPWLDAHYPYKHAAWLLKGNTLYCLRILPPPKQVMSRGKSIWSVFLNLSHWDIQTWCDTAVHFIIALCILAGSFQSLGSTSFFILWNVATWIESLMVRKFRHRWIIMKQLALWLAKMVRMPEADFWFPQAAILDHGCNSTRVLSSSVGRVVLGHECHSTLRVVTGHEWNSNSSSKQPMLGQTSESLRYAPKQPIA